MHNNQASGFTSSYARHRHDCATANATGCGTWLHDACATVQTVQLCNCAHGPNATVQRMRNQTSSQVMTVRLQIQLGVVHGYTTHVQLCKPCKLCNSARALPSPIILRCTVCLGSRAEAVLCIRVKESEPGGNLLCTLQGTVCCALCCAVYYRTPCLCPSLLGLQLLSVLFLL